MPPRRPQFRISTRKGKKYDALTPSGRWVAFGDASMQQYKDSTGLGIYTHLNHGDRARRTNYLARAKGIRNGAGDLTWQDPESANYYAVKYLW